MSNLSVTPVPAKPAASVLFEDFDEVRVVSLPHRIDRRHALDRELARYGAFPIYLHGVECATNGPFVKRGSHGAFLSHLSLLRWAGSVGRSILILQDDCTFIPDRRLQRRPASVDIWYGGWESMDAGPVESARLIGAHCIGFSATAARDAAAYLRRRYDEWRPGDAPLPPVDGLLVEFRWSRPDLRVAFDLVAIQRASPSDISPGRLDRHPISSLVLRPLRQAKTAVKKRQAAFAYARAQAVQPTRSLSL